LECTEEIIVEKMKRTRERKCKAGLFALSDE